MYQNSFCTACVCVCMCEKQDARFCASIQWGRDTKMCNAHISLRNSCCNMWHGLNQSIEIFYKRAMRIGCAALYERPHGKSINRTYARDEHLAPYGRKLHPNRCNRSPVRCALCNRRLRCQMCAILCVCVDVDVVRHMRHVEHRFIEKYRRGCASKTRKRKNTIVQLNHMQYGGVSRTVNAHVWLSRMYSMHNTTTTRTRTHEHVSSTNISVCDVFIWAYTSSVCQSTSISCARANISSHSEYSLWASCCFVFIYCNLRLITNNRIAIHSFRFYENINQPYFFCCCRFLFLFFFSSSPHRSMFTPNTYWVVVLLHRIASWCYQYRRASLLSIRAYRTNTSRTTVTSHGIR